MYIILLLSLGIGYDEHLPISISGNNRRSRPDLDTAAIRFYFRRFLFFGDLASEEAKGTTSGNDNATKN